MNNRRLVVFAASISLAFAITYAAAAIALALLQGLSHAVQPHPSKPSPIVRRR